MSSFPQTFWRGLALCAAILASPAALAQTDPCGAADATCQVDGGTYHMLPPNTDAPKGIVVHLHGGGGTGKGMLKSGLAQAAQKRGYIVIVPDGWHPNARFKNNWAVKAKGTDYERDDIAFLEGVLSDVQTRYDAAELPVMLAGFRAEPRWFGISPATRPTLPMVMRPSRVPFGTICQPAVKPR